MVRGSGPEKAQATAVDLGPEKERATGQPMGVKMGLDWGPDSELGWGARKVLAMGRDSVLDWAWPKEPEQSSTLLGKWERPRHRRRYKCRYIPRVWHCRRWGIRRHKVVRCRW